MNLSPSELKRLSRIVGVMSRFGFGYVLGRRNGRHQRANGEELTGKAPEVRVRLMLQELGPTFVKLGQMLSMRPDLIPPSYAEELEKLQSSALPVPWDTMGPVIESELGQPLDSVFLEIDQKPLGSASIAQAYSAVLLDKYGGGEVVLKTQRPGIGTVIDGDLALMRELAEVLGRNGRARMFADPAYVVEEFGRGLRDELDFGREAANIERFRANFAETPWLHIPSVYWELSSPKLLVEERLRGPAISDLSRIEEAGYSRSELAQHVLDAAVAQMLGHGTFHADLHPGNLVVLDGGVIGMIDFGMVGRLTTRERLNFARLMGDILSGHSESAADRFSIITDCPDADRVALAHDFERLSMRYVGLPDPRIDYKQLFVDMLALTSHGKCRLPAVFTLLFKALSQVADVAHRLDPSMNFFEAARPEIDRIKREALDPQYWEPIALTTVNRWLDLAETLPQSTRRIVDGLARGDTSIKTVVVIPEESRGVIREIGAMMAGAILTGALFAGSVVALALMSNDEPWWDQLLPWFHVGFLVLTVCSIVLFGTLFLRGRRRRDRS